MSASTLDAVLPLRLCDVERATVLFDSLIRHFRGLGALWVVCPGRDSPHVERRLREFRSRLDLRVLPETAIVPELDLAPTLKGWYRQQLVKLAMHAHVESALYLTLDADVICTRAVDVEALAPNGRAPCHVIEEDLHPDWYTSSEAVLGLEGRRGVLHNVTPAVLHREGVAALAGYLDERARGGRVSPGVRGMKQRLLSVRAKLARGGVFAPWRLLLAGGAPWTEYALYYTFLEARGLFERFHERKPCIYDVDRSVWYADRRRFESWDPAPSFVGGGPPWFLVIQSNTAIAPERVREKLGAYLNGV